MPRLFTGLELPADAAFDLDLMRGGIEGARWVERDSFHITLRFIGDVDKHTAYEVSAELDRLSHSEAFTIRLSHLGTFGGDKPRALYAGVENNEALQRLQAAQERVLRRAGLEPEGRKFVPHVTLARLRDTAPTELAHYLGLHPIVQPISFTARRVALMSSRDSVGGGPYVLEAAYPLGPSYPNRLSQEAWR